MSEQLSLATRPWKLDQLIGQEKLVARIRGHVATKRKINAWMFTGPTGTGKTTVARILAHSLNCTHQTVFGTPCKACRKDNSFDLRETNAAKLSGKEDIEKELEGADYGPRFGKYRIYIIDEAHMLSRHAQNMVLKYLEDAVESTVFIICSTSPESILQTLQGRCTIYKLRPLRTEDITVLVERCLAKAESELPADRLVDAIIERGLTYPRVITQAVEKYTAGASPDEAVEIEGSEPVDTSKLCRAMIKGDWPGVAKFLYQAPTSDAKAIRMSCLGYLRTVLLQSPDVGERTAAVSKAVAALCALHNVEDLVLSSGLSSALYTVTSVFARYPH